MITVASFDNQADAHIAKGRLEAEGLSPVLGDSHLVQTDWLYSAALGGIKLQVPEAQAERARAVLARDHSAELEEEDWAGPEAPPREGPDRAPSPAPCRWAAVAHLAALAGAVIPFGHLLGPVAVWHWHRGGDPGADQAGREAVNFQLSLTVYAAAGAFLLPEEAVFPGLVLLFTVDVILVLVAAAHARTCQPHRYPLTLRFLSAPTET